MDSMEWNKVFGAVLVAGIAYNGLGVIADNLVRPVRLEKSVLKIEGTPDPAPAADAEQPKPLPPIAPLLAKADVAAGTAEAKKVCSTCHNFAEGAGAKVGPELYNVVGRDRASMAGYDYSSALKGKPGKWTFDDLNAWLHSPKTFAPGTKMAFAGIDDDKQRADVIDYLDSLSHSPVPLPPAK